MLAETTVKNVSDKFNVWLALHTGQHKWIVARRSKARVKAGYVLFLTEKKFNALLSYFDREMEEVESPELHLTEPNPDLAKKRKETHAGMAFWAGTGPDGKTCRECAHWNSGGYLSSCGLLRDSPCEKYARMMNCVAGPLVPHYAKACKYFEPCADNRPTYKHK